MIRKKFDITTRIGRDGRVYPMYTNHYLINNWCYITATTHEEFKGHTEIKNIRVAFDTLDECREYVSTIMRMNDILVEKDRLKELLKS